ncbi:Co-chaperone protein HscB (Hsc20) [Candidatus Glomeribacter gigasporarum BEG34]|uniref:Co-chaperone protein HscB homolog n=1 Tax=Candidatus Glomeribacter gigasporarum BEG34 TaxID=1070319 RepID=G2JAD4_9BURK|nr:Fe-S protein assembly co-chaperone HscB [Candidatus Glomeribacter gigasporarum]CCD29735.1 Co-chaperone protein HscB (Hsc20) [Candidatus Glomeribacter gigasporarum BEG34]
MSLPENYFKLFNLAEQYPLDQKALDAAYHTVLAHTHPDHFAAAGEAQKRAALQWTARANEAYRILKDPLQRAVHLLQLRGIEFEAENNTAIDRAFLVQQMEWREHLEQAAASKDAPALKTLLNELRETARRHIDMLGNLLASKANQQAAEITRQSMFIQRVQDETQTQLYRLNDTTI